MTTTAERLFDSFLIVGLTTATSPPVTLSSTFSAVNQPSSAENGVTPKIIPENGFEFDSLGSSSSSVADVTSSILYHYPTGGDADPSSSSINPKSLCDFCFPDLGSFRSKKAGKKWKIKRETFSFVLTDTKGGKRWGYCYRRLSPVTSLPVCFCLLSFIPCFGFFSQLVQKLSSIEERTKGDFTKYRPLLEDIYARPLPAPGNALIVPLPTTLTEPVESGRERKKKDLFLPDDHVFDPEMEEWTFARPEDNDWMLDDINILPLTRFLSPSNILAVFTSLLVERRIIFVADNLSTLSSCVQAAAALLYPFSWQHIFIPVLPQSLLSFACAPMPYVIGVLRSSITELKKMSDAMEEVVVVDVDNNKFYAPPELLDKRLLPSYLSDPLLHSLEIAFKEARQTLGPLNSYFHLRKKEKDERKQQKQQRIEEKLERDIRYDLGNAFVGFFIDLLGNYKDFIRPVNEGGIREGNFDRTAFVEAQPEEVRPLLELIVQSQLFFMFIEDRKRKEVEEKRKSREGKAWGDWKRREMEREQELRRPGKTRERSASLTYASGSCIASFSSSSSSSSSSPASSASSSPSSSYTAFPLRSSASALASPSPSSPSSSSSSLSSSYSSSSESNTRPSDSGVAGGDVAARMQRKIWLQSRFSMYENGEISREDLAKRWKEIEKEERKLEKEKDRERKKGERKKTPPGGGDDDASPSRGKDDNLRKEDIVLLLDRSLQKKMSGERDRELDRKVLGSLDHYNSGTVNAEERAALRGTAAAATTSTTVDRPSSSLSSSSSSNKGSRIKAGEAGGKRFNPILKVSSEKREGSRFDFPSPPPPPPPPIYHAPRHSPSSRFVLPSPSGSLILHATKFNSAAAAQSSSSLPRSNIISIPSSSSSSSSPSLRSTKFSSSPASPSSSPSISPSSSPRFTPSFLPSTSPTTTTTNPNSNRSLPPVKLSSGSSGVSSSSHSRSSSSSSSSSSSCVTNNISTTPPSSLSSILSPRHHLPSPSPSPSASPPAVSPSLASSASGSRPLPPPPFRRSASHRPSTSSSTISDPPTPSLRMLPPPPRPPRSSSSSSSSSSSAAPHPSTSPSALASLLCSNTPPSTSSLASSSSSSSAHVRHFAPVSSSSSLGSSVSHASALPASHPVSIKSASSSTNLNNRLRSLTRSTTRKDDYDVSVADIGSSNSSSSCRGEASSESSKKEKKEKKKETKRDKIVKRNVSVQGLTVEEARRIQDMMDREWKEEKEKEKRNRLKKEEKKLFKGERKAMKEKEKSEKKKLKKQQTTLASSGEDRRGPESDFLLVTESFTRRRSHSDGAEELDLMSLKAELAAIEKAAGQNSRHAATKKPSSRMALDQSSILHSGYVLKKNGAGKGKGDSWERVFCVMHKRWLVFYAHKDDTEPVLRVKLKHVKHATFYRNISSLMLFDRENGFALTLDGSGGPVIHAATTTVEEGRAWSGAFQKALVSVKLA